MRKVQARLIGFVLGLIVTFPVVYFYLNYMLGSHWRSLGTTSVRLLVLR